MLGVHPPELDHEARQSLLLAAGLHAHVQSSDYEGLELLTWLLSAANSRSACAQVVRSARLNGVGHSDDLVGGSNQVRCSSNR